MTVTLTYGHQNGFFNDCDDKTNWTEDPSPTLTSTSLTVLYKDIFELKGTASAGSLKTYWEFNIDVSASIYEKWLFHFKTSKSAVGLGAKVEIVYSNPTGTEVLFGGTPEFSLKWKTISGTITNSGSATTIDKIRLYAVSDGICTAESVYYDFAMLHKGTFTFPYVSLGGAGGGIRLKIETNDVVLSPLGRVGNITQNLGIDSPIIELNGDMDTNTAWGTPDGQRLFEFFHESHSEPWQWLTSTQPKFAMKVRPIDLEFLGEAGSGKQLLWKLRLRKYDKSSGSETTWNDRQWYGHES